MNIQESLQQILASKKIFGELFYDTFFTKCPEVKKFFKDVNIERQAVALTMALVIIEKQYSKPFVAGEEYLKYLGTKHHDWKIPKTLYADWADAMIDTLREFHVNDWNDALEQQWRDAIGQVTKLMFEGYEQHFTV
jgi:hemoglobin-like flavoprotein